MIIPRPTHTEIHSDPVQHSPDRNKWIRWYINCPNWKCDKCEAVMFGRVKYCVYCKVRLGTHTARPADYVENEYEP